MRRFAFLPALLAGCSFLNTTSDTTGVKDTASLEDSGNGGEDTQDTGEELAVDSVSLDPSSMDLATTADGTSFTATATWSDGSTSDVTADCGWETSDSAVAWVSAGGLVHGLGVGVATANCNYEGQSGTALVSVAAIAQAKAGDLAINEVLADPPVDADVNGDGTADSTQDEFVEIVNAGGYTVDLEGATLWDADNATARHTFGAGHLMPGEGTAVFGGGGPTVSASRCIAVAAWNDDNSLKLGLALNNDGDTVTLLGADGAEISSVTFDGSIQDASMVLSPEIDGTSYTHHSYVSGSVGPYSPCTLATGDTFPSVTDRLGG